MEFYRNGNFADRLEQLGKPMIAHYHGQDLRNRGVIPAVDSRVRISLTNEYDLMSRHPDMHYIFLPYDVAAWEAKTGLHEPITICHATRNYYAKGSDAIIAACRQLEESHNIRFLLIDDLPHDEAMEIKKKADIYIDQVSNVGPGYGMNSIEAMSLGIACCTYMDDNYEAFLPDHPFVNVTPQNLLEQLTALVENPAEIVKRGQRCREWVEQYHGLDGVGDQLYGYYRQLGIIQ